jgi:hypothetical protein
MSFLPHFECVIFGCGGVTKYTWRRLPSRSSATQSSTTNNGFCLGFSNFVFVLKRSTGVVTPTAAAMETRTRETIPKTLARTTDI